MDTGILAAPANQGVCAGTEAPVPVGFGQHDADGPGLHMLTLSRTKQVQQGEPCGSRLNSVTVGEANAAKGAASKTETRADVERMIETLELCRRGGR